MSARTVLRCAWLAFCALLAAGMFVLLVAHFTQGAS